MSRPRAARFAPSALPDTKTGLRPDTNTGFARARKLFNLSTFQPCHFSTFQLFNSQLFRVPAKRGFRVLWMRRRCLQRGVLDAAYRACTGVRQTRPVGRRRRPAATKAFVDRRGSAKTFAFFLRLKTADAISCVSCISWLNTAGSATPQSLRLRYSALNHWCAVD